VAGRVPGHEQAREMARRFGGPLVSTSANRSGEEPKTRQEEVAKGLGSLVDYVLPGSTSTSLGPSRIRVAATSEILR
jgi:L-threonylcarbamoyladenylate synthase